MRGAFLCRRYVVAEDHPWLPGHFEDRRDPAVRRPLDEFKAELRKGVASAFGDPAELKALVAVALPQAMAPLLRALERGDDLEQRGKVVSGNEREPALPISDYPDPALRFVDRMRLPLPKRILAIDSGGVRVAATFGAIARIRHFSAHAMATPIFALRSIST